MPSKLSPYHRYRTAEIKSGSIEAHALPAEIIQLAVAQGVIETRLGIVGICSQLNGTDTLADVVRKLGDLDESPKVLAWLGSVEF